MTGPATMAVRVDDAIELAELLTLLAEVSEQAPDGVATSLWVCGMDDRSYRVDDLACDLRRFAEKLGGGA